MKRNKLGIGLLAFGVIIMFFSLGKVGNLFALPSIQGFQPVENFGGSQVLKWTGSGYTQADFPKRTVAGYDYVVTLFNKGICPPYLLTKGYINCIKGTMWRASETDSKAADIYLPLVVTGSSRFKQDWEIFDFLNTGAKYSGICSIGYYDGGDIRCWLGVYESTTISVTQKLVFGNLEVDAPEIAITGDMVTFKAYWKENGAEIKGANCIFGAGETLEGGMSEETDHYLYQTSFGSPGTVNWEILCSKSGYSPPRATGTLTVQSQSKPPVEEGTVDPPHISSGCSNSDDCEEYEICISEVCVRDKEPPTPPEPILCASDEECEETQFCDITTGICRDYEKEETCQIIDDETARVGEEIVERVVESKTHISEFDLNTCNYRNTEKGWFDQWTCFDEGCISNVYIMSIIGSIGSIGAGAFLLLKP